MNKKQFLTLILMALIIPQVAFASWWNPFSWNWKNLFRKPEPTPIIIETPTPDTTETPKTEEKKSEPVQKSTPVPVPKPKIKIESVISAPPVTAPTEKLVTLQITNINEDISKERAIITWETTTPAKAQLVTLADGKVFESENGLDTEHRVEIENPKASIEHSYVIHATSENGKDYTDRYDSFMAVTEYAVTLGKPDGTCQVVIVKDTAGKTISGKEITISGVWKTKDLTVNNRSLTSKTNSDGEVEYCEKSTTLRVTGEDISVTLNVPQSNPTPTNNSGRPTSASA